jgi:putative DNA primase/helicase
MRFTIYTADFTGNEHNAVYPHETVITCGRELRAAAIFDHVCAKYKENHRTRDNFLASDVAVMDCDNDHTENPREWVTGEQFLAQVPQVDVAIVPSRNNGKAKDGRKARPRFHAYFPIPEMQDEKAYTALKQAIREQFPFFDGKALDAARFLYGTDVEPEDILWQEGEKTIIEFLTGREPAEHEQMEFPLYTGNSIPEGSRNNTMSHFASRVLKRFGDTDKAYEAYLERAEKCEPPLPEKELGTIWKSALKFYRNKIENSEGYVPPEEYDNVFNKGILKPEDYSDMGEAKVLAMACIGKLRYTSATDYIAFVGDHWYEDRAKALGVIEDFMDDQLKDAGEKIRLAEEALVAIGVSEAEVKSRSKTLVNQIPEKKMGLFFALQGADAYKKFVMRYRNYRYIVNTQNAAKPMLALDVSELDYDPELLNTPEATYDLTRGIDGGHPHDPDDLITKITACSPGDKGMELWLESLDLFFCQDRELIRYVQQIVGMAAVGRVYAEQMIIAYGGGANGKSTFWNTIARVLGTYSGKISADALTMSCKRNVKPEMAELKGKRLIIASELEEGQRLNTGMVKQICSIDPIEAEKKYKDPFHFVPSHTLVLYTNYLPKVTANDDGTWRRLIVIPFNAKITGKSDIKNYSDYLFEHAGPAILKWVIEGAETAIRKGFKIEEPKAVRNAVEKYREDNDWLGQFLEDHCEIDPSFTERSGKLYQQYRVICLQSGEYIRSTTDFYGNLEKAGFFRHRTRDGSFVRGLKLKEGQDFLD